MRTPVQTLRHLAAWATAVLALAVALAGCRKPAIGTDVVVSIDGEDVQYSEFESYLRDNVDSSDFPLGRSVLDQLFDQFLDERLLIALALERGLGGEAADTADQNDVDQRTAISFLLRQARAESWREEEIAAYYEAHKEQYQRPESVRLQQILVHDRQDAEAAQEALMAGEDFARVAARFSQVPMAHLDGDGGRLAREDLPVAFADSIFELEPNEISEVFTADYGFHIFQVVERFPAEEVPFAEVAGDIRQVLERRRLDELAASFIAEARGRYNVRIYRSNFPFDYRGSYVQEDSVKQDSF